jgi:hypothetical protein
VVNRVRGADGWGKGACLGVCEGGVQSMTYVGPSMARFVEGALSIKITAWMCLMGQGSMLVARI